jgi:hypothetical protein|tara:strand:+ start:966 stop:1229 length:264 start_codon:yes stop_codon:yes gene_type:complete
MNTKLMDIWDEDINGKKIREYDLHYTTIRFPLKDEIIWNVTNKGKPWGNISGYRSVFSLLKLKGFSTRIADKIEQIAYFKIPPIDKY